MVLDDISESPLQMLVALFAVLAAQFTLLMLLLVAYAKIVRGLDVWSIFVALPTLLGLFATIGALVLLLFLRSVPHIRRLISEVRG